MLRACRQSQLLWTAAGCHWSMRMRAVMLQPSLSARAPIEVVMTCSPALSTSGWRAFYEQLQRYIAARVHNPADTEDLVQLVLERAASKRPVAGEVDNIAAWLFTIARNAVSDHRRSRKRALAKTSLELGPEPASESESAATPREREDVLACMQPLLAALPEDTRRLLVWADMDDRPLQSIADELGISLSATKSRVQRARKDFIEVTQRCCFITLDARGRVSDLSPRRPNCQNPCNPSPASRKS